MTTKQHYAIFWFAFWPCLSVFAVVYGAMFGHWWMTVLGGGWIVAVFLTWLQYYVKGCAIMRQEKK